MQVRTAGIVDSGTSLLLMLHPSEEIKAEQARIGSLLPMQVAVRELHITLMRSAKKALPPALPPEFVTLKSPPRLVSQNAKTSSFLVVDELSQSELSRLVAKFADHLGQSLANPERIFHMSLTNLTGEPHASVAYIWEYQSTPI